MYMRRKVCATATELLLLVVPGAVVLTAPGTVTKICCSVDTDYLAQMYRFWKAVGLYMNLPNVFRTKRSSVVGRNLNALLDSISQMFSWWLYHPFIWLSTLSALVNSYLQHELDTAPYPFDPMIFQMIGRLFPSIYRVVKRRPILLFYIEVV